MHSVPMSLLCLAWKKQSNLCAVLNVSLGFLWYFPTRPSHSANMPRLLDMYSRTPLKTQLPLHNPLLPVHLSWTGTCFPLNFCIFFSHLLLPPDLGILQTWSSRLMHIISNFSFVRIYWLITTKLQRTCLKKILFFIRKTDNSKVMIMMLACSVRTTCDGQQTYWMLQ